MKKELFEYTQEEASAYLNMEGVHEIDYVKSEEEGYKLFSNGLSSTVKLRVCEDGTFFLEVSVPDKLQCVPCELDFKTANRDSCPCCGTPIREIMLRNKVHEEPFRRFEGIYSELLNAALRVAQPVCAYVSDNFTYTQAVTAYKQARESYDAVINDLKPFNWVFEEDVLDKVTDIKKENTNVYAMKKLMGDEITEKSLLDFSK